MDNILHNYHDLYVKSDINVIIMILVLIADILENFKYINHKIYNLDPAHAYSTPGLA